jgi:hypothetical protein
MFSSISSYIWGGESEAEGGLQQETNGLNQPTPAPTKAVADRPRTTPSRRQKQQQRDQSPHNGDDWVLIGNEPSPGNLSGDALHPLPPVSAGSSVNGDQVVSDLSPDSATRVPVPRQAPELDTLQQKEKCLHQAQLSKQRNTHKALSSKALKRSNKAVTSSGRKQNYSKFNLPIKSAGLNKNLKQC